MVISTETIRQQVTYLKKNETFLNVEQKYIVKQVYDEVQKLIVHYDGLEEEFKEQEKKNTLEVLALIQNRLQQEIEDIKKKKRLDYDKWLSTLKERYG